MIGILGGMGPAATVDFLAKLIRLTRPRDFVPWRFSDAYRPTCPTTSVTGPASEKPAQERKRSDAKVRDRAEALPLVWAPN